MPQNLVLAVAQARTLDTTTETLSALSRITRSAAQRSVDLLLFPEAYLGGYPRGTAFGAKIGSRSAEGREQFLQYFNAAVDLGDTPQGAGDAWVERKLPGSSASRESSDHGGRRGDGTREYLEQVAHETGVFLVVGLVERCGGSLYCAVVYVCPRRGCIGKRRKVQPTGTERLVWAQGGAETLKAVVGEFRGGAIRVPLAAAICWENYMPLLRQSLYAQNVGIYLAPTADARDAWLSLMRSVGVEGRCWVLSACQCVKQSQLPAWVSSETKTSVRGALTSQILRLNDIGEHRTFMIANEAQEPQGRHSEHFAIDDSSPSHPARRRSSVVTKTPEQHEICWPVPEKGIATNNTSGSVSPVREKQPRRRSVITETADHHEICWPVRENTRNGDSREDGAAIHFENDEFVCRGGSNIVSPFGDAVAGPIWEADEELLVVEVDMDDCIRGRLDLDVAGSYSRNDAFKLTVEGLDLIPPS